MASKIDPVMMTVVNNYLATTTTEMGITMARTAYSSVFNEAWDFSTGVFDEKADMLAQGPFCPSQIAAIQLALRWIVDEFGLESFKPGDVYLHNDPFRGMCHLPEHAVFKAVYYDLELVGFVSSIGHMTEVGGIAPGGFPGTATEVFQEGLRIPPTKIMRGNKEVKDIWNIIRANVRTPRVNTADLRALISSVAIGEKRIIQLINKLGLQNFKQIKEELKTYANKRMRESIREIPDGIYEAEDYLMDNDGITDKPFRAKVKIIVDNGEVTVDYTGTDKQAQGAINCTFTATAGATYNAIFQITDLDIPPNSGRYRPIHIIAPKGTIVNVEYPGASVGGNSELHPKLVMLILRALAAAIPEKVIAANNGTAALVSFGGIHPETKEYYSHLIIESMGWGARSTGDGNDVVGQINANCRVTPVEILETKYPLRHEKYCLNENSGGVGRYRGGLGTIRQFKILAPEIKFSAFMEREKLRPWGLFGGGPGSNSGIFVKLSGDSDYRTFKEVFKTNVNAKFTNVSLHKGDCLQIITGGGGGYGNPGRRDQD